MMAAICGIIISLMVFGGTNYHGASINSDTNIGQNVNSKKKKDTS